MYICNYLFRLHTNKDTKHELFIGFDLTVKMLTWKIYEILKVKPNFQRLFFQVKFINYIYFQGILLDEPDYLLTYYGISSENEQSTGNILEIKLNAIYDGIIQTYFLNTTYFDPRWHIDFRDICVRFKNFSLRSKN